MPPVLSKAMAGAKAIPQEEDVGNMSQAMAWRVKYRKFGDNGKYKVRLPLVVLAVHPKNRGGAYPQGGALKTLGIGFARNGFSAEEADHMGIVVEDPECFETSPSITTNPPAVAGASAAVAAAPLSHR